MMGANKQCECDGDDKNSLSTTKLPPHCFIPTGECTWFDDCLKATFPCLSSTEEYYFIDSLCRILRNTKDVFSIFEESKLNRFHVCIQRRFFPMLIRSDQYQCAKITDLLDGIIGNCLLDQAEGIEDMSSRQFVFWTMKDLLTSAEKTKKISVAFRVVFDQPNKKIIPNAIFMIKTIIREKIGWFASSLTFDGLFRTWEVILAKTLQWEEKKISWDCKYSFKKEEENKDKRAIEIDHVYYTKIECKTGSSLKNGVPSEYNNQREILKGVDRTLKDRSLVTLSVLSSVTHAYVAVSGLTWCCYPGIGCIKNPIHIGDVIRNDEDEQPQDIERVGVSFSLFSRGTPGLNVQKLDIYSQYGGIKKCQSPEVKVYFVIHGYFSDGEVDFDDNDADWVRSILESILQKENSYVVAVDWKKGAFNFYDQAAINTLTVGTITSHVISLLVASGCTDLGKVHIIGHSLGAHTAGFAGASLGGKVGRITALDPAGPFFETRDETSRLDKGDALFVDVIHTNGRVEENILYGLGMFFPVGHADFYPNGGEQQPGCTKMVTTPFFCFILKKLCFISIPIESAYNKYKELTCNHGRCQDLFIESITSNCFVARECPTAHDCLHGTNLGSKTAVMGFGTEPTTKGYYYITTNAKSPFC